MFYFLFLFGIITKKEKDIEFSLYCIYINVFKSLFNYRLDLHKMKLE